MKPVTDILSSRWFISFVGTALLAGPAWFFAPAAAAVRRPFCPARGHLLMLLIWGGANILLDARRRRRDAALARGVTASATTEATEEAEALRDRLTNALDLLKRTFAAAVIFMSSRGTPSSARLARARRRRCSIPACGFRWPTQMGQDAVAGVGGTRLCDWWFTEDAVLIDTAGRYTTQDSNAAVDRAGWEAFLDLLKRTRPRQPLNGLIIAFPLSDISLASARRAPGACGFDPSPHQGGRNPARCPDTGLCPVHQGGSDRRLHRVLR